MLTVPFRIASVGVGTLTIPAVEEGVWVGSDAAGGESQTLQALSKRLSDRQVAVMRILFTVRAVFIHSPASHVPIPWTERWNMAVFVQMPDTGA
jgi:hypothetical protein